MSDIWCIRKVCDGYYPTEVYWERLFSCKDIADAFMDEYCNNEQLNEMDKIEIFPRQLDDMSNPEED